MWEDVYLFHCCNFLFTDKTVWNCGCDLGLSMKTTLTIMSLDYYGESSTCREKGQIGSLRVIPSVQGIETL
jgi:hypothetical protein